MSSGPEIDVATGIHDSQISLSQYQSELKAIDNESRIAEEANSLSGEYYVPTETLRNHIENPEPTLSGRSGIKGAHNKEKFVAEVKRIGALICGKSDNSQFDGVEKLIYRMPKKDAQGKNSGEYQASKKSKTVYDPRKISTSDYIKWGIEAANNAAKNTTNGKLGREWSGKDNQGKIWHGYCDREGNITSFYPDD